MLSRVYLYISVFTQFLFYLPGTFLHEAAHWIVAKLTFSHTPTKAIIEDEDENGNKIHKTVSGFTIIPKIKKDQVVYGHVLSIPKFDIALVFISAAPLVWIVALYYILSHYGYISLGFENGNIYFSADYSSFFSLSNWLLIYIALQLIWASTLSSQDIKMFFKGVFSPSSFILLSFILLICELRCNTKIINYLPIGFMK
ncbi:hypothetical protein [Sulfurimonas sp.]|uniref:hypothetical protein n=1 Tax=Sulfurimonas sp. TaxID=2022749 RepID=UPI0025DF819B|nr:hypothetical protein [Sulfurimonas sp.]MBW6487542.1 hypothetical protein [Sulfurimonas sp.]